MSNLSWFDRWRRRGEMRLALVRAAIDRVARADGWAAVFLLDVLSDHPSQRARQVLQFLDRQTGRTIEAALELARRLYDVPGILREIAPGRVDEVIRKPADKVEARDDDPDRRP